MAITKSKTRGVDPGIKFSTSKKSGKGKIPLTDPMTLSQMFVMIILHVCRKILLFNPRLKVAIYFGALFIGGLIGDFLPLPKTYLSKKNNIFNVYFVKLGWGWTLLFVGLFIYFTSFIYCCGNISKVKKHLSRLVVGTVFWYSLTNLFVIIEEATGFCVGDGEQKSKIACLQKNRKWFGFDISGHCFLLIYSSLILMEEAKVMKNWENISEMLRYEEFDEDSPLRFLKPCELSCLKDSYYKYSKYVRGCFVAMASLLLIWDVMLIGTILYFHSMVQKVMGGIFAISTWFFTYRFWYPHHQLPSPSLPGIGLVDYQNGPRFERRRSSLRNISKSNNGTG